LAEMNCVSRASGFTSGKSRGWIFGIVLKQRAICKPPIIGDVRHQDSTFAITALFILISASITSVSLRSHQAIQTTGLLHG
jgi:hypothetical protein